MLPFDVVKVTEVDNPSDANAYVATGRWKLLDMTCGQCWDGGCYACDSRYALGWLGPADPEHPEMDTSEFPDLPSHASEEPEEWV